MSISGGSRVSNNSINNDRTRQTIVVNQSLSSLGSRSIFVDLDSYQISFNPSKMIIRQLIYCNIAGTDQGTYLLWCNITGQYVGACYVGIQSNAFMPSSIVNLAQANNRNVEFRLDAGNAAFVTPTGNLTITLEFVE